MAGRRRVTILVGLAVGTVLSLLVRVFPSIEWIQLGGIVSLGVVWAAIGAQAGSRMGEEAQPDVFVYERTSELVQEQMIRPMRPAIGGVIGAVFGLAIAGVMYSVVSGQSIYSDSPASPAQSTPVISAPGQRPPSAEASAAIDEGVSAQPSASEVPVLSTDSLEGTRVSFAGVATSRGYASTQGYSLSATMSLSLSTVNVGSGYLSIQPPLGGSGTAVLFGWADSVLIASVSVTADTIEWTGAVVGDRAVGTYRVTGGQASGQLGEWHLKTPSEPSLQSLGVASSGRPSSDQVLAALRAARAEGRP